MLSQLANKCMFSKNRYTVGIVRGAQKNSHSPSFLKTFVPTFFYYTRQVCIVSNEHCFWRNLRWIYNYGTHYIPETICQAV